MSDYPYEAIVVLGDKDQIIEYTGDEVVRCEDCIHNHTKTWNQGKRDKPSCRFTDLIRSNKFYCGFGERVDT